MIGKRLLNLGIILAIAATLTVIRWYINTVGTTNFATANVSKEAFAECDEPEKKPYHLLSDSLVDSYEPNKVGRVTASQCWKKDASRSNELGGSFAQQTNNYLHGSPESCSAPRHELVGAFYEPRDNNIRTPL